MSISTDSRSEFEFFNASGQLVKFTHQDQDLLAAYNRIRRFRIRDRKDLRGTIVNIRDTHMLDNCLVAIFLIHGRPFLTNLVGMPSWKVRRSCHYPTELRNEEYVSTLIGYNSGFHHNQKVLNFIPLLRKADRFQQYCIIHEKPYNMKTWGRYREMVEADMAFDRSMQRFVY